MKKVFAFLLTLALSCSLSGCGGFEARLTRAAAQMKDLDSFHADMEADLSMSIQFIGKELDTDITLDVAGDILTDPLRVRMETAVSFPGSLTELVYCAEKDGDDCRVYCSADGGATWQKQEMGSDGLLMPLDLGGMIGQIGLFVNSAQSFTKAGTETIDGLSVVRYDGILSGFVVREALDMSDFPDMIAEQTGMELDMSGLDGREIPCSIWFDNASGRLIRYELELTEVMTDIVAQALRSALQAYGLEEMDNLADGVEVSRCGVVISLSQFNAVSEFELPSAS